MGILDGFYKRRLVSEDRENKLVSAKEGLTTFQGEQESFENDEKDFVKSRTRSTSMIYSVTAQNIVLIVEVYWLCGSHIWAHEGMVAVDLSRPPHGNRARLQRANG
jgi:hypothetical protein